MYDVSIFGNLMVALALTVLAGLSTGIGSIIAYFIWKPKMIYLSFSLGFSAGVMVYVSFMEMMPSAILGVGELTAVMAFFIGMVFIGVIDFAIPEMHNPHDHKKHTPSQLKGRRGLMRTGVFMAVVIAIHNFPEGLATLGASLSSLRLGAIIALAIAIHNIPEGISVSMPIFYATGNKKKAFVYSFASGLAEPLAAVIGLLVLLPFLSPWLIAAMLAFVAGIMVYISLDKILPAANNYGHSHVEVFGLMLGMLLMAVSIVMLRLF